MALQGPLIWATVKRILMKAQRSFVGEALLGLSIRYVTQLDLAASGKSMDEEVRETQRASLKRRKWDWMSVWAEMLDAVQNGPLNCEKKGRTQWKPRDWLLQGCISGKHLGTGCNISVRSILWERRFGWEYLGGSPHQTLKKKLGVPAGESGSLKTVQTSIIAEKNGRG